MIVDVRTHLSQLYATLNSCGWKVVERSRGDVDVEGAATWELRRGEDRPLLLIDFAGLGGMGEDIPREKASRARFVVIQLNCTSAGSVEVAKDGHRN